MPTTEQLRSKLIHKLKELFQLNQPDLDFGFYRIMHAKSEQVSSFIENDLLHVIQDTFGQADETKKDKLKQELDNAIQTAIDFGAPDPETTPKVMEARARYEAIKDSASSEAEIYDHLYRFFERYYDDGDFISRRYYTRETPGKAAPFAVPYNGEEVKLHWANADQYYIKTTEYFSNFSVNLSEALKKLKDGKKNDIEELDFADSTIPEGLKVHFSIVDATEGDHANVKASDATKRYFIIHKEKPIELNDKNELIINFEYKPTMEKTRQETLNQEAVALVIKSLKDFEPRNSRKDTKNDLQDDLSCDFVPFVVEDYLNALSTCIPTEKDKDRILLTKYINQYTSRNTMDYFIHKNLGAFLKRELDFYIKNEIMRLDDIENAEAPKVEDYLTKIKVLRKIAIKLIEFMAQLEDFQKKLWLKKKFIVETNYCITLDRIPEELYPEIIANQSQHDEWIKLFAIDEIEGDTTTPAYSNPLSLDFLKTNNKLVLDTRFFDVSFRARLLSSIEDFDEQCDGLLIHSENTQALNLLQDRYREQVKCVYIDPPYNTGGDGFVYKDSYQDSSWLSLIQQTTVSVLSLLNKKSVHFTSIDDREQALLRDLYDNAFSFYNRLDRGIIIWNNAGSTKGFRKIVKNNEYITAYSINSEEVESDYGNNCNSSDLDEIDERLQIMRSPKNPLARVTFPAGLKIEDPTIRIVSSPINPGTNQVDIVGGEMHFENGILTHDVVLEASFPYKNQMIEFFKNIGTSKKTYDSKGQEWIEVYFRASGVPYYKKSRNTKILSSVLRDLPTRGSDELYNILPEVEFDNPKPVELINELMVYFTTDEDICLDYFAGSGTTGHATIYRNRDDGHNRRYVLVEMGDYFDTVLMPRISKVVYSKDWKDGKPKNRETGVSHCFKYLRLESYEDTLNNLVLKNDPIRDKALEASDSLKEDYLLHYMLDVESKGSQSLLNIDAFNDPTSYVLKVKKPGSDEYIEKAVDLIETFNYLIGLRLVHLGIPQSLTAAFTRMKDPDLPQDQDTKLIINGDLKQVADGKWWIRKVEGWVPKNPYSPNDGLREKVLIVWRKLTGNFEEDNLILDSWFQKNRISTLDWEFDTIYVNGSNNLPNLQKDGDTWKVRLIEEEFMKRMWDNQGV
jgi:adenine-specific DNA-methyltransferase